MRAFVIVLTGCGRIGFGSLDDAAPALPPFGEPVRIAELPATMSDPVATPDLRTLYLAHASAADIWTSTRASATSPWGAPVPVASLSAPGLIDSTPTLSADGSTMWLAHNATPGQLGDIWFSTRTGSVWSVPQSIPELASSETESPGSVFDGDLQIAFTSERTGRTELWALDAAPRCRAGIRPIR